MRRLVLPLAVLLSLLSAAARADEILRLPGMRAGGTVVRDSRGIPHITGFTEWDLHFLTGYTQAQDRLFQMDYLRRQASGTLAELLGPAALSSDVQLRALGLRRTASSAYNVISKEARDAMNAYATGVNAWALNHPLPPEYAALEITKFEPWTAVDSLAFANLFLLGQFFDQSDATRTQQFLTYQATGAQAGFDGTKLFFEDVARFEPFDHTTTLGPTAAPPGAPFISGAAQVRRRSLDAQIDAEANRLRAMGVDRLLSDWLAKVETAPYFQEALKADREHGSNEWGVSKSASATGNPMIANDPHLSLGWPSTWYPMALKGGPIDATGMGAAGLPLVLVGQTPRVAWGATNNPTDVTDMYVEQVVPDPGSNTGFATVYQGKKEAVIPISEVFRQNNPGNGVNDDVTVVPSSASIPPATLVVPRRNLGPIVSLDLAHGSAISIQYTGTIPTREVDGFRIWNTAKNLDDFRRGMSYLTVGSFNWAVADADGNLAYLTSGELPLREDLQAGTVAGMPPWLLRNGTGGNEWKARTTTYPNQALPYEILPPDERPKILNPLNGFVNANNDPIGVTLTNNPLSKTRPGGGFLYLNYGYDGFRAARITQLITKKLANGGKISFDDMKAIQADNVMIDAQVFVPYILRAYDNATRPGAPVELIALALDPNGVPDAVLRLKAWEFSTPTGITEGYDPGKAAGTPPTQAQVDASVAATIYSLWRSRYVADTVDAVLAPFNLKPPATDHNGTLPGVRHLLDTFDTNKGIGASGLDFFVQAPASLTRPEDRRDYVILKGILDAIKLVQSGAFAPVIVGNDMSTWRWGKLHRITFAHPLGGPFSVPPGNGVFPAPLAGVPGIPRSGGIGTVDVANHPVRASTLNGFMFGSGPSRRYVGDVSPSGIHAETSLPGGVSALPTSPYYVNLLPMWLVNGTYPAELSGGPTLPWLP
jgi:penicillin amidase